jgi:regulator of protease activity HflC (stomatin/prohibitin superfamily)
MFGLYTVTLVPDRTRGLRTRNGKLVRWLEPGRHVLWFPRAGTADTLFDVDAPFAPYTPELAAVAPEGAATDLDVPYRKIAVLSVDGRPSIGLPSGRYLLWQVRHRVTADLYDTEPLHTSVPEALWRLVPAGVLQEVVVLPHERVVVYVDGELLEVLGAGRYGLNVDGRTVTLVRVDLREQEVQIAGQDVMSADKVTLRINVVVRYRVTDPAKALTVVTNVRDALYAAAQLSARRLIASTPLDALLESRNGAAEQMLSEVAPRAPEMGAEVLSVDLKDLILPGEMKTILNQVIEAEKRAAANVILRREETAATRSLANTAKLLEQNPVLLRLKELESLERLAEKVGSVTVVASPEKMLGALRLQG